MSPSKNPHLNFLFPFFLLSILFSITDVWAYSEVSPYSYCNANPIKYVDPSGKDVVILNYGNDIWHQHLALLVQNEEGKWQYYSINGDNVYISGEHRGGRTFNDIGVGEWETPQEFLDSEYNKRTEESKEDKSVNNFGYKEGYQIETTTEQDQTIKESFENTAQTEYKFLGNNCATAVQKALFDADIKVASPSYELIKVPANKYWGDPEYIIKRPNFTPVPSKAFKSIMKLNPSGEYLQKTK